VVRLPLRGRSGGMLLGDIVVGRILTTDRRDRLLTPLRPLLALPYLGFLFHPPVGVALVLGFVASAGDSASLVLQERLAHEADPDVEGQVFGLFGNGQMVGQQSLGALAGGLLATVLSPATSMGLLVAASVLVTVSLNAGLRRSRRSLANV